MLGSLVEIPSKLKPLDESTEVKEPKLSRAEKLELSKQKRELEEKELIKHSTQVDKGSTYLNKLHSLLPEELHQQFLDLVESLENVTSKYKYSKVVKLFKKDYPHLMSLITNSVDLMDMIPPKPTEEFNGLTDGLLYDDSKPKTNKSELSLATTRR